MKIPFVTLVLLGLAANGFFYFENSVHCEERSGQQYLSEAQTLYHGGQYFRAARYAFAAQEADPSLEAEANSWITLGLSKANLYHSAAYFFIRTLQSGNKAAIRRALSETQGLLIKTGPDLLRKYMIRHTTYDDYDGVNRSAYLFALAKEALLTSQEGLAVGYVNGISKTSPLWPFALLLRGSALAMSGKSNDAINDFKECVKQVESKSFTSMDASERRQQERETQDLKARCLAGQARTLYQIEKFEDADRAYDHIPKESFVWPDILFEHAWNSYAKQEFNRTLGKLVTYKSPALEFVYNSEVDVLRAQTFLMMCLYNDANNVINEFNSKYVKLGEDVKDFVEQKAQNLPTFYEFGKAALHDSLYTKNLMHHMANRFVRGPYFQNLVQSENSLGGELRMIREFAARQPGVAHEKGFPGFLEVVLSWRKKTIQMLGGAFVKNSLLEYHSILISDFEKMAFIKLEMLSRAKDRLVYKKDVSGDRLRGNIEPSRRDDQFFWSFNGEFWNDELGDYVFGLESECNRT